MRRLSRTAKATGRESGGSLLCLALLSLQSRGGGNGQADMYAVFRGASVGGGAAVCVAGLDGVEAKWLRIP